MKKHKKTFATWCESRSTTMEQNYSATFQSNKRKLQNNLPIVIDSEYQVLPEIGIKLKEKQLKLEAHSIDLELSEEERQNAREKLAIVKVQQEKAEQLLSNKKNNSRMYIPKLTVVTMLVKRLCKILSHSLKLISQKCSSV